MEHQGNKCVQNFNGEPYGNKFFGRLRHKRAY